MTKKKESAKPEATKAEAYFIEQHWGKKSPEEIATELEISSETVTTYLQKMKDAGLSPQKEEDKPSKKATDVEKAGFAVHDPIDSETGRKGDSFSTIMTGAAADIGDKATVKANGGQQFINSRLKDCIHVINPKLPVR